MGSSRRRANRTRWVESRHADARLSLLQSGLWLTHHLWQAAGQRPDGNQHSWRYVLNDMHIKHYGHVSFALCILGQAIVLYIFGRFCFPVRAKYCPCTYSGYSLIQYPPKRSPSKQDLSTQIPITQNPSPHSTWTPSGLEK